MNWLIYIGGWALLGAIVTQIVERIYTVIPTSKQEYLFWLGWTLTWIWICWKFIH